VNRLARGIHDLELRGDADPTSEISKRKGSQLGTTLNPP
jgi:hypothetical protein